MQVELDAARRSAAAARTVPVPRCRAALRRSAQATRREAAQTQQLR